MATQQIKDILNTEVPSPSFVLSPSVPAPLPSEVTHTRNGQDNVARTLDPYSRKFEHVPEDTPRVYGSDQSLLVEASRRTNYVHYSADYTQWGERGTTIDFASSIFGGQNATAYKIINNEDQSDSVQNTAGSFSSSTEVIWAILEEGNSTSYEVGARDTNNFNTIGGFIYDLQNDNIFPTGLSNTISVNKRTITNNGPNGGKVVLCVARYDPTDGVSVSGAGREAQHFPDTNGNSGNAIVHQTQIEEAPNATSPIVTGSSAKTRAGDEYTIFDYSNDPDQDYPEWWNPNEGTIFTEIIPTAFDDDANVQVFGLDNDTFRSWGKLFYSTSTPVGWTAYDGTNGVPVDVASSPFSVLRAALSIDGSQMVASANGQSNIKSYNGNLLSTNTLTIGEGQKEEAHFRVVSIRYYPRALSESTLNILTT